jgi:hypothetical protein
MEARLQVLVASLLVMEAMVQVLVVSLLVMEAMLQGLVVTLLGMEAGLLPMGLQMQVPVPKFQSTPSLSHPTSRHRQLLLSVDGLLITEARLLQMGLQMQAAVLTRQFSPPLSQLTSLKRQMLYNWMMTTTTKMMITLSTRHQHLGEQSRGHPA